MGEVYRGWLGGGEQGSVVSDRWNVIGGRWPGGQRLRKSLYSRSKWLQFLRTVRSNLSPTANFACPTSARDLKHLEHDSSILSRPRSVATRDDARRALLPGDEEHSGPRAIRPGHTDKTR